MCIVCSQKSHTTFFIGGRTEGAVDAEYSWDVAKPLPLNLIEVWRKGGCGGWWKADFKLNA